MTALVPDIPRWVEVRGMLLSGRGQLLDVASSTPPSFVVVHPDKALGAVIGGPSRASIAELGRAATEILAEPEHVDWVASALPGWSSHESRVYKQGEARRLATGGQVRQATHRELLTLPDIPKEFREELLSESDTGTPVFVAFAGDRPASFCYPAAVTETWWQIAVATLEPYRRQGFAQQSIVWAMASMRNSGRQPVWGAARSSPASARLAERLGFVPVDTLVVFRRT